MPGLLRQELRRHVPVFLAEKRFYGCGGLEISEAIRLLIAAQACLLILNRKTDYYGKLQSILVYPSAFVVNRELVDEAGVCTNSSRASYRGVLGGGPGDHRLGRDGG